MIRGFEPSRPTEPEEKNHLQWSAAIGAGLIAGGILLIVPRGSPWSALTFFAPVIVGRIIPDSWDISLLNCSLIHLAASLVYSLIISRVVAGVTQLRAIIAGGMVGLFLYLLNLAAVSLWIPGLRGGEGSVAFTHIVFGMIAAGAYRGMLRRRTPMISSLRPS